MLEYLEGIPMVLEQEGPGYTDGGLRLKLYTGNNLKTDTAKAWRFMDGVQVYQARTLNDEYACLLLPGNMSLSFGEDDECNGFMVGDELNPEAWRSVFDACKEQFVNRLPPVAEIEGVTVKLDESWTLGQGAEGEPLRFLGGKPMVLEHDGPAPTDGGGAAAP